MKFTPLIGRNLDDNLAERARRNHEDAIAELQTAAQGIPSVIATVQLADATITTIAHGLGRAPRWIGVSVQRGGTTTGRITDLSRNGDYDRSKLIALRADGYTATITVDLAVL